MGVEATVLIGYGSMGRNHARMLNARYPQMAVVDYSPQACQSATLDYPHATVARSLNDLDALGWEWANSISVIASWGTSHAPDFARLVELGVRRVVCEKPMADSIEHAAEMIRIAHENDVVLGHHFQRRYNGLVPGVRALAKQFDLGVPCTMFVQGGAAGLITNGIHLVDFAIALFDESPQSVVSTACGEHINPRSPDLQLYGGTAIWSFSKGRGFTISFNNRSSLAPLITVYYRDAVLRMRLDSTVSVYKRDEEEIKRFPAVTRTGIASNLAFEGLVPHLLDAEQEMGMLLDEVEGLKAQSFPSESALEVLSACIGALEAGSSGMTVPLPIEPNSDLGRKAWPIS